MKTCKISISHDMFRQVYQSAQNLEVTENKGWIKIQSKRGGMKVYVQKRDQVNQVHISNWSWTGDGVIPAPVKNGRVYQWLDMNHEDPVQVFTQIISHMMEVGS